MFANEFLVYSLSDTDEIVNGTDADEFILNIGAGNDIVNGGDGIDEYQDWEHTLAELTLSPTEDGGVAISDGESTDILYDVEYLQTADGRFLIADLLDGGASDGEIDLLNG